MTTRINGSIRRATDFWRQKWTSTGGSRYFKVSTSRWSSDKNSPLPPFSAAPSFRLTQSPNPSWKIGQGLSDTGVGAKAWKEQEESQGWKTWALDGMQPKDRYPLLISAIVPRPIAFVSSLSSDGVPNLAPFSYFSMISHEPPLLTISIQHSARRPKDTRTNILATKEFTVNIISEPFAEAANSASIDVPPDVDEWAICGLTKVESVDVKPARVKESAVSLECQLYYAHDICLPNSDTVTHTLILGLMKRLHARNAVISEDGTTLDPSKLKVLSRLGGTMYARTGETFELARTWKTNNAGTSA